MKLTTLLPLAVTATGLVLPDAQVFEQILAEQNGGADHHHHSAAAAWWDKLPSKDEVISKAESAGSDIWSDIDISASKAKSKLTSEFEKLLALGESTFEGWAEHPRHPPHEHSDKTIWELVSTNEHTTRFAAAVADFPDIRDHLNTTTTNSTLFVPTDAAFEHIPPPKDDESDKDKERRRKFIHGALQYHIAPGVYAARRLLLTHTLPTALKEPMLGGEAQRLRVQLDLKGLGLNFFTRIIKPNIGAANGIIHAVDHILVPPPFIGRELSLVPSLFSTLLLAYEKTHFVDFIHNVRTNGTTFFAPTNGAFARLGFGANAFLFNSPKGLKYLEALLKYQIVANETFYSDAVYKSKGDQEEEGHSNGRFTVDLPTLLPESSLRVEVSRWAGFIRILVNGRSKVVLSDGIAKNGVIHVVDHVPIPPCKHHQGKDGEDAAAFGGEISVEDLKARLEPYLEQGATKEEEKVMKILPIDEL